MGVDSRCCLHLLGNISLKQRKLQMSAGQGREIWTKEDKGKGGCEYNIIFADVLYRWPMSNHQITVLLSLKAVL